MTDLAIGIDLGGTQVRGALIDGQGRVLSRVALRTAATEGPQAVIEQLGQVAEAMSSAADGARIAGVGVCAPGPLDAARGIAVSIPTLAGFVDLPLARMLEERVGLPVGLENDGIAAAIAEWRFGAGRDHDHLVYLTISTGIGGGVIADGRPLRGRNGMAGHLGHMTIVRDGALCPCGNRGCWEAHGSGTALALRARERMSAVPGSLLGARDAPIDAPAVFDAAAKGDALALELVREEADILGIGIVNLMHLYSPTVIVVGGGVARSISALLPGIRARSDRAAMPPFRNIPIVLAELDENSGVIGAATLILDGSQRG